MDKVIRKYKIMYNTDKRWLVMTTVAVSLVWGILDSQPVSADVTPDAGAGQEKMMSDSDGDDQSVRLTRPVVDGSGQSDQPEHDMSELEIPAKEKTSTDNPTSVLPDEENEEDSSERADMALPVSKAEQTEATNEPRLSEVNGQKKDKLRAVPKQDTVIKEVQQNDAVHSAPQTVQSVPTTAVAVAPQFKTQIQESIDDWMPNKRLQELIFMTLTKPNQFNRNISASHKVWNSASDITKEDMGLISYISTQSYWLSTYIDGKTSYSLKGLEWAKNLTYLDLMNSQNIEPVRMNGDITDISPLRDLSKLTFFQVANNRVADITPIAGLNNIDELTLSRNCIADFSSLNSAQYKRLMITDQTVVNDPVYVNVTEEYAAVDPVKAPQGQSLTYHMLNKPVAFEFVTLQTDPNPISRVYVQGATSYRTPNGIIHYQIKYPQHDGPTRMPNWPEMTLIPNEFEFYLISQYDDADGIRTVVTYTPYVTANYDKNVIVNYLDVDNKEHKLDDTKFLSGLIGENYSAPIENFKGYELTAIPDNAKGTFSEVLQKVDFYYKKITPSVTIHYEDDKGAKIHPDSKKHGRSGAVYNFVHPNIAGYTYKETRGNAKGIYTFEPSEVTFVYTQNSVVKPPVIMPSQNVMLTVHYQTATGVSVAPDVRVTGKMGDSYTTSPATNVSGGYELVEIPDNANGVFGNRNFAVTYVYAKRSGNTDVITPDVNQLEPTTISPAVDQDKIPETGNQANLPTHKKTATHGGTAVQGTPAKTTTKPINQSIQATLPRTNDKPTSPFWGMTILWSLLGLVGIKQRKH